jgi:anaerobic ribonucleoside-triphosphate reductase activating protein
MPLLNLAAIRECTEAEGPGKRFAIWSQGCPRKCKGCCNPNMQPFIKQNILDTDDVKEMIQKSKTENNIEGVSFIGGEPMLQAEGFADVAKWCHKNDLSVLVFTGFLYQELLNMHNTFVDTLLANIDLLVDGPYLESQPDYERDWIGSTNQNIIFLTDRYSPGIERQRGKRRVECFVSNDKIMINGWPIGM